MSDVVILPTVRIERPDATVPVQCALESHVYTQLQRLAQKHWNGNVNAAASDLLSSQVFAEAVRATRRPS